MPGVRAEVDAVLISQANEDLSDHIAVGAYSGVLARKAADERHSGRALPLGQFLHRLDSEAERLGERLYALHAAQVRARQNPNGCRYLARDRNEAFSLLAATG